MALSFVAAAALGPAAFADWVFASLILQYSSFAALGFPSGAGREIPMRLGRGHLAEADIVEGTAHTGTIGMAIIAAVLGGSVAGTVVGGDHIALLVGGTIIAQHYFFLQQAMLRARFRFGTAAAQLAVAGIGLLVVGVSVASRGVHGLLLAMLMTLIAASLIGLLPGRRLQAMGWDGAEARRLVRVGLPIMLAGFGFSLLTTVDRWLVLGLLGETAFGVYGLVGIAVSGLLTVAGVVSQQYYPRLAFAFGANLHPSTLLGMARHQGRLAMALVGAVGAGTIAVAWVAIPAQLPSYSGALVPGTIAIIGVIVYSGGSGYGNLLNSVGAQGEYFMLQLIALAVDVVTGWFLIHAGAGLSGVAIGLLVTMTLYTIALRWRAALITDRLVLVWSRA